MVNPLNPTPEPTKDPTLEQGEGEQNQKEKEQKEKDKLKKQQMQLQKALINSKTSDGKTNFQALVMNLERSYILSLDPSKRTYYEPKLSKEEYETIFIKNKKEFLKIATSFEKKYKKSILDVIAYDVPMAGMNENYRLKNQFNSDIIKKVYTTSPEDITPVAPIEPGVKLPENVPLAPSGTTKSYFTVGDFTRTQDQDGNPVYMYNGDKTYTAVPIALIGDANGNAIRTTYNNKFNTEGIDPSSPVTVNGALNTIIQQLQSTPDGVKKFKEMAIAKHIIPPSAANVTMGPDLVNVADGTTLNAINFLINAVTNYNVTLADMGKSNQKFIGVNDYLANMPALSISDTKTSQVYKQIQPKDYELNIDQMFQGVLGRGATADELKHFTQQLQSYANKNPQVTTETITQTATGDNTSTTVSGGLTDAATGAMMQDEALKNPEAEEFNKGSKFFNWFQEAISSPVQLGG
jgi:hypothetical protein